MAEIYCPWCDISYSRAPAEFWSCPDCSDAFVDPYPTRVDRHDIEVLVTYLSSLKKTKEFSKYLTPDTVWINSFWGSQVDENVDHLLLAFENVLSSPTIAETEKFEEYVRTGAVQMIPDATEHTGGEIHFWRELIPKSYGRNAVFWSWENMFEAGSDFETHLPRTVLRNLAAIFSAIDLRSRSAEQLRRFCEVLEKNYDEEEKFLAPRAMHGILYNIHRQFILRSLTGVISSGNSRAEAALSALGDRTNIQGDLRPKLIQSLFVDLKIFVPRDLSATNVLDFRTSEPCRRLRRRIAEVAQGAESDDAKRQVILSDLRRELARVNSVTERWGRIETVILTGAMAGLGEQIGGLAGAIYGGAGGVALSESLKDVIRNHVGGRSWAYIFHKLGKE